VNVEVGVQVGAGGKGVGEGGMDVGVHVAEGGIGDGGKGVRVGGIRVAVDVRFGVLAGVMAIDAEGGVDVGVVDEPGPCNTNDKTMATMATSTPMPCQTG
jgi:hypothetical protein